MEAGIRLKHNIHRGAQRGPYGVHPVGFLTYGANGRMTSLIIYGGRKPLSFGGGTRSPQEEQAEAFTHFLFMPGDTRSATTRSPTTWKFARFRTTRVRGIKFEGDRITLVTPPMAVNGKIQTIELIWERLPGGS
jgi:hypothetical protein